MRSSTESNLLNPRPRLSLEQRLTRAWQRDSLWLKLLLPLSWVFAALSGMRRRYLQARHQGDLYAAPVIVVGNISVGGSGKTPLIVALIAALKQRGYKPGVVSRGYGGTLEGPVRVDPAIHTADQVGDEPLLLAAFAEVWVSKDRALGGKAAQDAGATVVVLVVVDVLDVLVVVVVGPGHT